MHSTCLIKHFPYSTTILTIIHKKPASYKEGICALCESCPKLYEKNEKVFINAVTFAAEVSL
jgi:hypothetical protein